ncbi:hypothetical protein JCM10212_003801 [Sporobolomyces blumeae]
MTTAVAVKPRLVYSLPTRPPIPFPVHPSYPIRVPTRDLGTAYLDSLWTSNQADQVSLESFARLVLALRAQEPPDELARLLRSLVRPLHDFDRRWRSQIPDLLEADDEDDGRDESGKTGAGSDGIDQVERDLLFDAYERWEVEEAKRVEAANARKKAKGKEKASDQDAMDHDQAADENEEDETDAVDPGRWVTQREIYETRLQALLLLALLSISSTIDATQTMRKGRGRKKKDPERDSATLDPALLLDFLTDRLQIWRVMQSISYEDTEDKNDREKREVVEQRDTVQEWWADVVEPLFRQHLPLDVLAHHRVKLFPESSMDPAATSTAAQYEERSLMSLDKSARRRDLKESRSIIAESPTMKRLMSKSLAGRTKHRESDVFKVPLPPNKRSSSRTADTESQNWAETSVDPAPGDSTSRTRPRKQERPRPLPRGDSATASMRDMLKRREVSLARKTSTTGVKKKGGEKKDGEGAELGRKRKRKSASPQKLGPSSRAAETVTLVPDTPAKPVAKAPSFKKPFSRAVSLPSFAALGAAFRPGARDPDSVPLPFGIPPPPVLPGDRMQDDMDWNVSSSSASRHRGPDEEDGWLESREQDWHAKGGRQRHTSGSTEDEEMDDGQQAASLLETPKKARELLVPDT